MRYFLCIFLPPIAVLTTGKPLAVILNVLLTLIGWLPGVIHAIIVTDKYYADKRTDKLIKGLKKD